jgi:hypothetical protein
LKLKNSGKTGAHLSPGLGLMIRESAKNNFFMKFFLFTTLKGKYCNGYLGGWKCPEGMIRGDKNAKS